MAEVLRFPTGPRRLRVIEAREIGVIVPFPRHASQRRMDQLLHEHIGRVLQERLERQRRWDADRQQDW